MKETNMTMLNDAVILDGPRRTRDGYLTATVKVARTGIQIYKGYEVGRPEMDEVRVYRPEPEVFNKDALNSFTWRPVTIDHPREMVNADNWKTFAVGQTGDEWARDGEFVRVPMVLMDAAAIDAVASGKKQLSMGYVCDLKFEDGVTPNGENYDAVQSCIRGNHLAIVAAARGGPKLSIGDATEGDETMDVKLTPIVVDGLEVQVTDATAPILKKYMSAVAKRDDDMTEEEKKAAEEKAKAEEEKKASADALVAKDAEIAALKSQVDEEKEKNKPENLDAAVKDRAELIGKAKSLIGDKFVADGKDSAAIRREVVSAKMGDTAKAYSDEQVVTAFDTLASFIGDGAKGGDKLAAAIRDKTPVTDEREKAYDERNATMTQAWKTPGRAA
jgi:uncharacterized protein